MFARVQEPKKLMLKEQATQYAETDFEEIHSRYPQDFKERYPDVDFEGFILDIGCGPADITIRFAQLFQNATVRAIDGSPDMLDLAKERIANHPDKSLASRIKLDWDIFPLRQKKETADLIICNGTLHHFHKSADLWDTVLQHSDAGTHVYITDLVRPDSEDEVQQIVRDTCMNDHPVHVADYTNSLRAAFSRSELESQLERFGLADRLRAEYPVKHKVIIHGVL